MVLPGLSLSPLCPHLLTISLSCLLACSTLATLFSLLLPEHVTCVMALELAVPLYFPKVPSIMSFISLLNCHLLRKAFPHLTDKPFLSYSTLPVFTQ